MNPRRRGRRRFRRNPALGGFLGRIGGVLIGGVIGTGGFMAQNFAVSKIPDLITTADPANRATPVLNGLLKDGIVIGATIILSGFVPAGWRRYAEPFIAGQAVAATIRAARKLNVPELAPFLGAYEPMRFASYIRTSRALPPAGNGGRGGRVSSGMGSYINAGGNGQAGALNYGMF
jgi:hypothetical protein